MIKSTEFDIQEIPTCPWYNMKIDQIMGKECETTLLLGQKNSGKSTLTEYFLNRIRYQAKESQTKEICAIDCDLGQNQNYPASVSLKFIKY